MRSFIIQAAVVISILITGCGASTMSFNSMVPAPLTVSPTIETIVIVDRAMPDPEKPQQGILAEGAATRDRAARQHVLDGLRESMGNTTRFSVVRATEEYIGSTTGTEFPEPVSPAVIKLLAGRYNADAVVALETYNSDFIPTGGTLTEGMLLPNLSAQGIASVQCGFRMYTSTEGIPIDEFRFVHRMDWKAGGNIISGTLNALAVRSEAINSASLSAGIMYGQRITPGWIRISRDYFRKGGGNQDLAEGARMMQLNDWNRAIASLTRATETGKRKARGRAAHNLAVVHEILGNLEEAKEWTTVAWGRYREKKSRNYGNILTRRIIEQENLREQMR
jgi:hypothetical protein